MAAIIKYKKIKDKIKQKVNWKSKRKIMRGEKIQKYSLQNIYSGWF